ncbi:MAG: hypothetical protein V8T87_16855 [Victivallales bacterium]
MNFKLDELIYQSPECTGLNREPNRSPLFPFKKESDARHAGQNRGPMVPDTERRLEIQLL